MTNNWPTTFEEAIDKLLRNLTLEQKKTLANVPEEDIIQLHMSLGLWVRNAFGLANMENRSLLRDIATNNPEEVLSYYGPAEEAMVDPDPASSFIVRGAWRFLNNHDLLTRRKTASY